jgi:hypothetical protein
VTLPNQSTNESEQL